jgi:hypothetical protein
MPCLRRSVAGLSPRMPWFDSRPVQCGGLWRTQWHCDRVFCQDFGFHLSIPFHQRSVLVVIYTLLLPEEETGEAFEPSKKQSTRGALDTKALPLSVVIQGIGSLRFQVSRVNNLLRTW